MNNRNSSNRSNRPPLWGRLEGSGGVRRFVYAVGPWLACTANCCQLPFKIDEGRRRTPLLRSPDRKPGLADIQRKTSRIKEFTLGDAIVYSYCRDLRFVLAICLIIGFSAWWGLAPDLLLERPAVLCSPDLELVSRVVKDTFVDHICSTHKVSSPCDCGEPLKKVAKDLFSTEEPSFDPLKLNNAAKVKAFSGCYCSWFSIIRIGFPVWGVVFLRSVFFKRLAVQCRLRYLCGRRKFMIPYI